MEYTGKKLQNAVIIVSKAIGCEKTTKSNLRQYGILTVINIVIFYVEVKGRKITDEVSVVNSYDYIKAFSKHQYDNRGAATTQLNYKK